MRYRVDSFLTEAGLFWCIYEGPRLVEAFHGEDAEGRARARLAVLNR